MRRRTKDSFAVITDEMRVAIFLEVLDGHTRQVDIAKKHSISGAAVRSVMTTVVNKALGKCNQPRHPATKSPYAKDDFAKHLTMKTKDGIHTYTLYSASYLHVSKIRMHKAFWMLELNRMYPELMKG